MKNKIKTKKHNIIKTMRTLLKICMCIHTYTHTHTHTTHTTHTHTYLKITFLMHKIFYPNSFTKVRIAPHKIACFALGIAHNTACLHLPVQQQLFVNEERLAVLTVLAVLKRKSKK